MERSARELVRAGAVLVVLAVAGPSASQDRVRGAVRVDPVTAIIEALRTHQVVAFGEIHWNAQIADLRLTLLRDPRFSEVVRDIVVEFGTAKHQDVIDKYTSGGDVASEDLEHVWSDTAFPNVWANPIYKQFYQTVRDVTRSCQPIGASE